MDRSFAKSTKTGRSAYVWDAELIKLAEKLGEDLKRQEVADERRRHSHT